MNVQGDLFPSQLLSDAVRPTGNRDEAGKRGEAIHALGDKLQAAGLDVAVMRKATPSEIWATLRGLLVALPQRKQVVAGQFLALRALLNHARKA